MIDTEDLSDELYDRAEALLTAEVLAMVDSTIVGFLGLLGQDRIVIVQDKETGEVQPGVMLFSQDMRVLVGGAVTLTLAGALDEVKAILAAKGESPVYTDDTDPEAEKEADEQ